MHIKGGFTKHRAAELFPIFFKKIGEINPNLWEAVYRSNLVLIICALSYLTAGCEESGINSVGRFTGQIEWIDLEGRYNPVTVDDCEHRTWDTEDVPHQGWRLFGSSAKSGQGGSVRSGRTTIAFCDEAAIIAEFDSENMLSEASNTTRPNRFRIIVKPLLENRVPKPCINAKTAGMGGENARFEFRGGGDLPYPRYRLPWEVESRGDYASQDVASLFFDPELEHVECGRIDLVFSLKER